MSFDEILLRLDKLDEIAKRLNADNLIELSGLKPLQIAKGKEDLQREKEQIQEQNRLLKIGILGRVKAGKSSFLNALFFKGESILPKAATPMTAALTELKFSQEQSIRAEFYTPNELAEIKKNSAEFEKRLKEKEDTLFKNLKENALKKAREGEKIDEAKLRENAKKNALRELKSQLESLAACYEQEQKIQKNPLTQSELKSHELRQIQGSLNEVKNELLNFVGESGKFMPYTKSLCLNLDDEFLKDVQIIDTPGLNDPMKSRSARTSEFLNNCDAVLVLSPAEQFLDASDTNLIAQLSDVGGAARIVFVASKADSELFGSEKDKANGDLNATFMGITKSLEKSKENALRNFASDKNLLQAEVLQRALNEKLIIASSLCASIVAKKGENLDEMEAHILGLLKEHFKGEFEGEKMWENLAKLANVESLNAVFSELRKEKDKLIAKRVAEFVEGKNKALEEYKSSLKERISSQLHTLKTANLEEITQKEQALISVQKSGTDAANEKWERLCDELIESLREKLKAKRVHFFARFEESSESSKGSKTESYKVKDNDWTNLWGLWTDRYKTVTNTYTTFNASAVRKALQDTCLELEELLNDECESHIKKWRYDTAQAQLLSAIRKEVGDENIDFAIFRQTIKQLMNSISYPSISYTSKIPENIRGKSGMLIDYEAETFIKDIFEFTQDFKLDVRDDINSFIADLEDSLNLDIGERIFKNLTSIITATKEQLKNAKVNIERYTELERELENA